VRAVERVLRHEGGRADDPADPGGPTRFGISRRSYPGVDLERLTRERAIAIYFDDFWRRFGYDRLAEPIGAKMLDLAVNVGPRPAARLLQRALRAAGERVSEDGVLGPLTVAAAARADRQALLAALRSEAAGHYRLLASANRGLAKFLRGWLNRAYA
jgi:lysozyme family protein